MTTETPAPLRRLPVLDLREAPTFEKLATCVHCGLCLEACPTYRELRLESDSPRGRIYLMRGILTGKLAPTEPVLEHLDRCLDCRACETACPSGVDYSHILERTRSIVQPLRKLSPPARFLRWFVFGKLLPSRGWQKFVFALLWLQQAIGLAALGRWLGRKRLLPGRLANAAAAAPHIPLRSFRGSAKGQVDRATGVVRFAARGERKARVALFTGCVADRLFADVNHATVEVLTRNGCDVELVPDEGCCGALHIHNGARDQAKPLAQANVRAFDLSRYDAVVSNAAGCSAELRHYGELLGSDPAARAFGAKIRDVSEWLVELGWTPPAPAGALKGAVAYDEPCHLLHAQKISQPPKQVLAGIPGIRVVPLDEADACCGSAGAYSLLQPALAGKVSDRKVDAIRRSGADTIVTGNPGCLMQIKTATEAAGLNVRVLHPIVLLAESYLQADRASV